MQNQEPDTTTTEPINDPPKELTIDSIEAFFIEQGTLIETQLKSEPYDNCPVCSAAKEFLEGLGKMLESSLTILDIERNAQEATRDYQSTDSLRRLKRDLEWYDMARSALANLLQSGHAPERVMRSHPELIISKTQKRTLKSGKHRKQIAKESRRKNRK